jgi:hypothetical protein
MQITEEQKATIRTQFSARRRNQIILTVPLIGVIVLLALSDGKQPVLGIPLPVFGTIALVVVLGGLAFSLYNWRCPACNKYLGKGISPRFCAKCGVPLA